MSEYDYVETEKLDNHVGRMYLSKSLRQNIIGPDMLDEMEDALEMFIEDNDIYTLLITGRGRAFSAGADLDTIVKNHGPHHLAERMKQVQRVYRRIEEAPLTVVAGIDGTCNGGGMELAMTADIRVASESSTFSQTEVGLGIVPGWGGTQRLPQIVGIGQAKEIILTSDEYDAETMEEYGFLNEVASDDEFEDVALRWAEKLASNPPLACRYAKQALNSTMDYNRGGYTVEGLAEGVLSTSDDMFMALAKRTDDEDPDYKCH